MEKRELMGVMLIIIGLTIFLIVPLSGITGFVVSDNASNSGSVYYILGFFILLIGLVILVSNPETTTLKLEEMVSPVQSPNTLDLNQGEFVLGPDVLQAIERSRHQNPLRDASKYSLVVLPRSLKSSGISPHTQSYITSNRYGRAKRPQSPNVTPYEELLHELWTDYWRSEKDVSERTFKRKGESKSLKSGKSSKGQFGRIYDILHGPVGESLAYALSRRGKPTTIISDDSDLRILASLINTYSATHGDVPKTDIRVYSPPQYRGKKAA